MQKPDAPTGTGYSERGLRIFGTYALLLLLVLAPIIALGGYVYRVSAASTRELVRGNHLTTAVVTRELVTREFEDRVHALLSVARAPDFVAAAEGRDEAMIRMRLGALVEGHPQLDRAFVTDRDGLLWSDYPKAPESIGETFSHRDWYVGVSEAWKPYVSTVYRRHAAPQPLLVAVAVPVLDGDEGEVIGALVCQMRLEGLTELLRKVAVGQTGFVFLLDHAGVVAAHPHLDLQKQEYTDYWETEPVRGAREAAVFTAIHNDPFAGKSMLATALRSEMHGGDWTIVVQQPVEEAFHPLNMLRLQIAGAGLFIAVLLGICMFLLAKRHLHVQFLSEHQTRLNAQLHRENAERKRAETELQKTNDELESRVEERTRELREKEKQLLQAQKMEAIGHLAGGVAHDFNNLLTIINGLSDMVLSRMDADNESREDVREIAKAGQRATLLTRQLLAFSRKQVLKPVALNLNEVAGHMHKILERVIGEDIVLETRLQPDLHWIRVDPGQIEQVIMNLAVNARDAMPGGASSPCKPPMWIWRIPDVYARIRIRLPERRFV